jgi:poly-gamma-glutamate synthesis protein (capsule biosynthesis protein)
VTGASTELIFVGDCAIPLASIPKLEELENWTKGAGVVANLEGPILECSSLECEIRNHLKFNLYSTTQILGLASRINLVAAGMGNNHINDYVGGVEATVRMLNSRGIGTFGTESEPEIRIAVGGEIFVVLGACSPTTDPSTDCERSSVPRIFSPSGLLRRIQALRSEDAAACIVVFVHWGYELSRYPQPADREWARRALAAGADFVIGHHPHLVQGVETFGKGVVAYSLGNFFLPQVLYRDRVLRYRDESVNTGIGLAIGRKTEVLWFQFDPNGTFLKCTGRSPLSSDPRLSDLTPFAGLSDANYRRWFRSEVEAKAPNRVLRPPTLTSYFGIHGLMTACKLGLLRARRQIRRLAIRVGWHTPYNWN